MARIILGSQSPRRKEILSYFKLPFTQVTSDFDESSIIYRRDPIKYVTSLALGKAHLLAAKHPDDIIITADTIVYRSGKVYNKPRDEEEAYKMLSELVGKWHSVFTGVAVIHGKKEVHGWEETRVLFNSFTEKEIRDYHKKVHWADKAGGYAIQMAGGLIVKKIDGCYYNVVGLPINTVHELLKRVGIELWNYVE
jgi:septum formation protein